MAGRPPTILGVMVLGSQNELVTFSAGAAELLGLTRDAMDTDLFDQVPKSFPLRREDVDQARRGCGVQREMRDASGTYLVDLAPLASAANSEDEPAQLVVSLVSLNELVQQRSRVQRLARMVDASPEMVAELNASFQVRTWNRGAEVLLGHPASAVLDRPLRDLIAPGHRGRFDDLCQRAVQGDSASADSVGALTSDGREVTMLLSMTAVRDELDETTIACFGRDVTRRRLMESDLREREERLLDLYDHAPDLHASIDPDSGLVIECNRTLLDTLKMTRESVVGRPAARLCTADSIAELEGSLDQLSEGGVRDVRMALRTSDGSSIAASLNMTARIDDSGVLTTCRAVWRDVRRLERTESELREEVRRRERFLAMLSHELRNPLNAIAAASAVLQRTVDAESQPMVTTLIRQTSHLRRLLDDLLDVSRVTQDKLALKREATDLREPIRAALEATIPFAKERKVAIDITGPSEAVWVHGDRDRLQQVASNLINNAIKFADPDSGEVRVCLQHHEGEAKLRVEDNGPGVAGSLKDTVFDLFVQSDATLERSQGGLGVGLTLVRSLMSHHGGTVEVERSDSLGGACFIVRLPTAKGVEPHSDRPQEQEQIPTLRVLVVEDLAGARQALVALLEMDGHVVEAAEDGVSAVNIALEFEPDVLICDIGLPELDGYEVIQRLREHPTLHGMKAIALTGYGAKEDVEEALQVGFDAHLTKPLKAEHLDVALRDLFL